MHRFVVIAALVVVGLIPADARAGADRESLVKAWESHIAAMPATESFEKAEDGTYHLVDTDLPYDGELVLRGALVRPIGAPADSVFSHTGLLEFELTELAEERLVSQLYYYWIADKQMLYYSTSQEDWVSQADYTGEFGAGYTFDDGFGFMSFMLKYGIWILLVALIVFIFRGVSTQMKKNRALMDETAAINEKARENVDRAQAMQDEVLAITRQSLELQTENNETLKKILAALNR